MAARASGPWAVSRALALALLVAAVLANLAITHARAADTRPIADRTPRRPGASEPLPPAPTPAGPTSPGPTSPGPTSPGPTSPGPTSAGPTSPGPTPTTEPRSDEKPKEEKKAGPYTEGWHAGTPPGDLFHLRLEDWIADTHHGAAFEFDHNGRRVGALHAHSLGYASTQPVFDGGFELDAGDYGWYSFDYWQLVLTARTHRITDGDHLYVDTLFPQGDLVQSRVEQHYAKIRDGVDVRYRFPLGEDSSFDINFGPVLTLALCYESMDVNSVVGPRSDGSHYFALSLVPGLRLGADLHATSHLTVRAGADIDWLPELPHVNPLSFTREPSMRLWHDVRAFVAFRVWFVEIDAGYRFFEVYSGKGVTPGGGRLREGIASMKGFDWGVSVAF